MIVPVILSGGSGSRLWPLSRPQQPKQLLAMVDERTMLRATLDRLRHLDIADPLVVCNAEHHHLVASQLRRAGFDRNRVILEPIGRNTAPAAAAAAHLLIEEADPVMVILPADHLIEDEVAFTEAVRLAVRCAEDGLLVTFGIVPSYPETGFGYIRAGEEITDGARSLDQFVEKPSLDVARDYLESGDYLWNSGMFVFKASIFLTELERFAPDIDKQVRASLSMATRQDGVRLETAQFAASPSDSIDFAVMEHTSLGAVIPLDAGWNDLGSWAALWETGKRDADGNVIIGDVASIDVTRSYLRSESRLLAAVGLTDAVVVETSDAILIAPRDRAQDVKQLVDDLKGAERVEADRHVKEVRPWGTFEVLDKGPGFQVKRLTVRPGRRLSLQRHEHRAEHWTVAGGTGEVTVGSSVSEVTTGDHIFVPAQEIHRIENSGTETLVIIEVQLGDLILESDIERIEDDFGRS